VTRQARLYDGVTPGKAPSAGLVDRVPWLEVCGRQIRHTLASAQGRAAATVKAKWGRLRTRKTSKECLSCPYRKPTQVGE
jgi:hypothetical protein